MRKEFVISFVAGVAVALGVVVGLRSSEAEAATSPFPLDRETELNGSEVEAAAPVLTLDSRTGLPAGSLVFHVEDHTCIALPTGEMDCFCSCSSEACNTRVEVVPLLTTPTITDTDPTTSTPPTASGTVVPDWGPELESDPDDPDDPDDGKDVPKGNNGLGNGEDDAPPGISRNNPDKGQNDEPAEPGNPQYNESGGDSKDKGKGGGKKKD